VPVSGLEPGALGVVVGVAGAEESFLVDLVHGLTLRH
jgi:hypothetical protein